LRVKVRHRLDPVVNDVQVVDERGFKEGFAGQELIRRAVLDQKDLHRTRAHDVTPTPK
jgi:hypothetical protein